MAELHVLGQVLCAKSFKENSIFCRYSFQSGPNWTLISGCSEGQTVSGQRDCDGFAYWSHPLDVHYVSKGIQGWPKLIFQVSCLDTIGRSWVVGYSTCCLPAAPGLHKLQIPCWSPAATTIADKLRQRFLGGSHQISQPDIISLGNERFKLSTQSKGSIVLSIGIVLRNFTQFGVEYK